VPAPDIIISHSHRNDAIEEAVAAMSGASFHATALADGDGHLLCGRAVARNLFAPDLSCA
jgi:hypothetical protein